MQTVLFSKRFRVTNIFIRATLVSTNRTLPIFENFDSINVELNRNHITIVQSVQLSLLSENFDCFHFFQSHV